LFLQEEQSMRIDYAKEYGDMKPNKKPCS
jgi:hypothetical protein